MALYGGGGGGGGGAGGISYAMGGATAAPPRDRPNTSGRGGRSPSQYEPCDSPNTSEKVVTSLRLINFAGGRGGFRATWKPRLSDSSLSAPKP